MFLIKIAKQLLYIGFFVFWSSSVLSESCALQPISACFVPKHLSLHEAIALALRNNPQIRSAELQRVVDRFALEVARNQFFPQYSFDASATYSNGTKPFYTANPKASMLTPLGTTIDLGLFDQVNAGRETAAFVQVTQPLLRGFGPAVTQAKYKTALTQETINCLNFKETLMTTILNVSQAYYKLVQDYNTLRVDQLSLTEVTRTLHASMLRIKAGKLAATEVVQQQAQSANLKTNLVRDKNILLQDYRAFLILLGLDPRSNLQIDRAIKIDNQPIPCPDEAIKIALCKNIEFKRSLAALKQLELALILAKDEQRWKLDLIARGQQAIIRNRRFATVSFDQLDAIGNDTPGAGTVVVNLNVPIHDLSRKQNLVRARIALQQAKIALETQRQQLIASVLNSIQTLQTQREQLKLSSEAATYSRQSLYIAQRKFEFGRTTMFEVTSLQTSLVTQEIAFISEQISYLNNFAAFEKLLGISLDKWCV